MNLFSAPVSPRSLASRSWANPHPPLPCLARAPPQTHDQVQVHSVRYGTQGDLQGQEVESGKEIPASRRATWVPTTSGGGSGDTKRDESRLLSVLHSSHTIDDSLAGSAATALHAFLRAHWRTPPSQGSHVEPAGAESTHVNKRLNGDKKHGSFSLLPFFPRSLRSSSSLVVTLRWCTRHH